MKFNFIDIDKSAMASFGHSSRDSNNHNKACIDPTNTPINGANRVIRSNFGVNEGTQGKIV